MRWGRAGRSSGASAASRFERQAATPRTARRLVELISAIDVTAVLASIRVPTLVMHRRHDPAFGIEHARDLAAGIPGARFLELPGTDHFLFSGDTWPILAAVAEFVTGASPVAAAPDRFLATVLSAGIAASIATAAYIGDARLTRLLDDFAATARRCVEEHHGRLVSFSGDRLLATFDGPGRGVRAACDLRDALAAPGHRDPGCRAHGRGRAARRRHRRHRSPRRQPPSAGRRAGLYLGIAHRDRPRRGVRPGLPAAR